jgi:hypothetical protein
VGECRYRVPTIGQHLSSQDDDGSLLMDRKKHMISSAVPENSEGSFHQLLEQDFISSYWMVGGKVRGTAQPLRYLGRCTCTIIPIFPLQILPVLPYLGLQPPWRRRRTTQRRQRRHLKTGGARESASLQSFHFLASLEMFPCLACVSASDIQHYTVCRPPTSLWGPPLGHGSTLADGGT